MFISNYDSELDAITTENGIYVEAENYLLNLLSEIEPNLCHNYLYISFEELTRGYSALIMRKERVDMLESMNVIVAERMSYVDDFIQSNQLNDECRAHIFPVYTPDPKYSPLQLVKINSAFVFLFTFLCVSMCVLIMERMSIRWTCCQNMKSVEQRERIEIRVRNYDKLSPKTQKIIEAMYVKMCVAIEHDANTTNWILK
jgi:hypothetical protein